MKTLLYFLRGYSNKSHQYTKQRQYKEIKPTLESLRRIRREDPVFHSNSYASSLRIVSSLTSRYRCFPQPLSVLNSSTSFILNVKVTREKGESIILESFPLVLLFTRNFRENFFHQRLLFGKIIGRRWRHHPT